MPLIRQLLAGRDFARDDESAYQMVNFVYLLGDEPSRQCVLIDPAWDIEGLLALVRQLGLTLTAGIVTHGHPDHAGGNLHGISIAGMAELTRRAGVPAIVHEAEADKLLAAGVDADAIHRVKDGERFALGATELRFLHTPGHTAGAMCIQAGEALFTGDTLFVDECGRVDLPGSNPDDMWRSLQRLKALPPATVIYPGHDYGPTRTATIEQQRQSNPWFRATWEEWSAG